MIANVKVDQYLQPGARAICTPGIEADLVRMIDDHGNIRCSLAQRCDPVAFGIIGDRTGQQQTVNTRARHQFGFRYRGDTDPCGSGPDLMLRNLHTLVRLRVGPEPFAFSCGMLGHPTDIRLEEIRIQEQCRR